MNFYDIIESFAAKTQKPKASKTDKDTKAPKKAKDTTRTKDITPSTNQTASSSSPQLTTLAAGSIILENVADEIVDEIVDKEDSILNGNRRSRQSIEQFQQQELPQTQSQPQPQPQTQPQPQPQPQTQDAKSCDRVEDKNLEFRKPYLFMLKPPNDIMKNNEYNYRLISNVFLNNDNLNTNNKRYLYLFGLFPCKYIPSAYIPLNRKKLLENTKRLDVKDSDITNVYTNKNEFIKQFHNKIKQFTNTNTIYNNLNLSIFGIILIIYWSIVLLFLNYVMLYYYRNSFNNILVAILFILLIFSIVWKMIYTVQN